MYITRPSLLLLLFAGALASCGGSGGSGSGGSFLVLSTEPANNGTLFLNEPIAVDFSTPVDPTTANLNNIAIQVFDAAGNPVTEQPTGTFRVTRSPGDNEVGRRLEFVPRFPTNNTYTNGGFKPGRGYLVQLVGGEQRRNNVLLDTSGRSLEVPASFLVFTANGSKPSELFRDTRLGGPRLTGFEVTGGVGGAYLNEASQTPVEVILQFDQPLNPSSNNVPIDVDVDPRTRANGAQGRIFLQYDDTERGPDQWIPARVALTRNELQGSEVRLFPVGLLPNNANVEVIVEITLEDMAGESNIEDLSYEREVATFRTQSSLQPRFGALVESFDNASAFDLEAPFLEPVAELGNGYAKANFDFEGSSTILDYQPASQLVTLNADFTQITPKNGPPINVSGGVFQFRDVRIPAGVTVRGTGSNPMVWLVTGDFVVEGALRVDGGDGDDVNSIGSGIVPVPGGIGNCGGGAGGAGSPDPVERSVTGGTGEGPDGELEGGGLGGRLAFTLSCGRASGGGGGSFATAGDPFYKQKKDPATSGFTQQTGIGGYGCLGPSGDPGRWMPGGSPGPMGFTDVRGDNDFWGAGVDMNRQIRIVGELSAARGGSGGGGGGDLGSSVGGQNFVTVGKGGGGGGGGGVLIIKALGTITIGEGGTISANGGDGGGGGESGGNTKGGGGGGGSGGMVVLMAGEKIRIEAHGETYAAADPTVGGAAPAGAYDFAISADGGVGTQRSFGGVAWSAKYPPPDDGEKWDRNPAGAFGGLGVVQLMVPAGDNSDGTNTVLDDNIEIIDAATGMLLAGSDKERYLAWRGLPDVQGVWRDDFGAPTYNNDPVNPAVTSYPAWAVPPASFPATVRGRDSEGDIRPAPVLLPAPFGHKSRLRSRWIDLGAGAQRLPVAQFGTSGPRRIREDFSVQPPLQAGPRYEFAGTQSDPRTSWVGYVDYEPNGLGGVQVEFPTIGGPRSILSIAPSASFEGRPAYEVTLAQPSLGAIADRYAQYQAVLEDAQGRVQSRHRIVSHDAQVMFLSPDQGPLPAQLGGLRLQIVAQFFGIDTNGAPGLGPSQNGASPIANVRFGFAFHRDPARPQLTPGASGTTTVDLGRFPSLPGTFLYDGDPENPVNPITTPMDLSDPMVQEMIRAEGFRFVMWDVQFNTRFSETEPGNTSAMARYSPSSPRPVLRYLVLPYRF